jgi:glucans biosynthesis protein
MHGGAKGSGAPRGNRNALKHGVFTRDALADRKAFNQVLREMRQALRDFDEEN